LSPAKRSYRISAEASADLHGIAAYIAQDRPAAARRVLKALRDSFRRIASHPTIGTARNDLGPAYRQIVGDGPARRYVIIFRATSGDVEILAVVDGSRDWEKLVTASGE
jgi:plasmid stabilization system protein ParE